LIARSSSRDDSGDEVLGDRLHGEADRDGKDSAGGEESGQPNPETVDRDTEAHH
jgi:hypothetical protein